MVLHSMPLSKCHVVAHQHGGRQSASFSLNIRLVAGYDTMPNSGITSFVICMSPRIRHGAGHGAPVPMAIQRGTAGCRSGFVPVALGDTPRCSHPHRYLSLCVKSFMRMSFKTSGMVCCHFVGIGSYEKQYKGKIDYGTVFKLYTIWYSTYSPNRSFILSFHNVT